MNRRAFFRTMVGGIAATAAVRTWPFRVFSFPAEVKVARALPMDLGFNVFDYAGIPIIEDTDCPENYIFALSDRYILGPNKVRQFLHIPVKPMAHCRLEGITIP